MNRRKKLAFIGSRTARDAHVLRWPFGSSPEAATKIVKMNWGRIVMTPPGSLGEPGDIRIEFGPSVLNRKAAFEYTKRLHDEGSRRAGLHIKFIAASDHYHLLVAPKWAAQTGIASGMLGALFKGALHGRGTAPRRIAAAASRGDRTAEG